MIIHSALARHVCVLLGYLYPALASAKTAVQQDPKAFTQWMTYWVVISVFAMGEILFDFFVSWCVQPSRLARDQPPGGTVV